MPTGLLHTSYGELTAKLHHLFNHHLTYIEVVKVMKE